jgi:hypothetical protein
MNYKVMKRPMFKMGGPTSGGTGITSGLETPRQNFAYSTYGEAVQAIPGMFEKTMTGLENRRSAIGPMALLRAAASGAFNEVGSLGDLAMSIGSPEFLTAGISGMESSQKLDSQIDALGLKEATTMATLLKPKSSFGSEKVYQMKKRDLDSINSKIAEAIKLDPNADVSALEEQKKLIFSGFETEASIKSDIADAYFAENGSYPSVDFVEKQYQKRKAAIGQAEGGRINKQMGGGFDMGQAPQETNLAPMAPQETNLAPQGQDPFTILRSRLPQEISDEVVSLIAYNKKAFADFANIQDQDDVDLFNQKYNVQLVVDLASR